MNFEQSLLVAITSWRNVRKFVHFLSYHKILIEHLHWACMIPIVKLQIDFVISSKMYDFSNVLLGSCPWIIKRENVMSISWPKQRGCFQIHNNREFNFWPFGNKTELFLNDNMMWNLPSLSNRQSFLIIT